MKKPVIFAVLSLILIFSLFLISADIPQKLNVHGRLTNSTGSALSGTHTIAFGIYNVYSAGSSLWDSGGLSVTSDSNGIYDVLLNVTNLSFNEQYYLGVTVGSDSEMTPRINLTSSPYSFRANVTDYLNSSSNYEMQNLTLGQKITFAFGEIIDNIVDGMIGITGGLNVTGDVFSQNYNLTNGYLYSTNGTYYLSTNPFGFYNSTTLPAGTETLWNANYSTFLTHITWANANNGTLMLQSNWNATNTSYYLATNPFGFYNSTTLPAGTEALWNANYSTFLNKINWTQAVNGTLMLQSNWNVTNTSYYLATNPFGFYNSTTLPAGTETLWNANYSTFLTHVTWANANNGTLATWAQVMNGTISSGGSGVPVNTISAFNQASCPTGWVLADGTAGTPDLRGIFIRGSGTNGVLSRANGTRFNAIYGTYKNDSFQGHYHTLNRPSSSNGVTPAANSDVWSSVRMDGTPDANSGVAVRAPVTDSTNGVPRTGAETSPTYYATIYCVKTAEDTPVSNTIWGTTNGNVILQNLSKTINIQTNLSVSSGNIVNFSNASTIYYAPNASEPSMGTLHMLPAPAAYNALSTGTATTWTDVNVSLLVPAGAKAVYVLGIINAISNTNGNSYAFLQMRKNGSPSTSDNFPMIGQSENPSISGKSRGTNGIATVEIDASRILEYSILTSGTSSVSGYITVLGYYI